MVDREQHTASEVSPAIHTDNIAMASDEAWDVTTTRWKFQQTFLLSKPFAAKLISINDVDSGGRSVLHWAMYLGNMRCQRTLAPYTTHPGTPGALDGKDEYYTTCSDVDVVAGPLQGSESNPLPQQDPQTAAVPNYQARTAYKSNPL